MACTPKISTQRGDWIGAGPTEILSEIQYSPLSTTSLEIGNLRLESQNFSDFIIDDGYKKSSSTFTPDIKEKYTWTQATWVEPSILKKEKKWSLWKSNLENAWKLFFKKNPGYKKWKLLAEPQMRAFAKGSRMHPYLQIYLESPHGEPWELHMAPNGDIEKTRKTGSQFQSRMKARIDSVALVFPEGPKKSKLQKVIIPNLTSFSPVGNPHVSVDSMAAQKMQGPGPYEYPPSDPRSDETHAFHFINTFYSWIESTWKVRQPFHVNVVTHMGFPQKTNTAFYFQNLIRLGSGDDKTFSRLPLDPSIVIHESSHAIIDGMAHLPFENEGGSLNEGFADSFTTLYLKSPHLGDNSYMVKPFYRRSVETPLPLDQRNGGLYHDSLVVSGCFWQLRTILGEEKTWNLMLLTLSRLMPNSQFNDFARELHRSSQEYLKGPDLNKALELYQKLKLL